uniref:Uncharacterized protein n=1 Tax=Anguilla anguilla TaxID=7936 RepID=A0A0E9SJR4_ANGAN
MVFVTLLLNLARPNS